MTQPSFTEQFRTALPRERPLLLLNLMSAAPDDFGVILEVASARWIDLDAFLLAIQLATQSGMWFLTATTPIDAEYVELRLLFLVPDQTGDGVISAHARAMIDATVENTSRDVPIWEHKIYVERAPLVPDDGPIRALRTWARQFYPEPLHT